ncbi:type I secretion system permease/ATPase [Marimonas lutisalis]|uniref:type I secretion system permease/ATPase n=1 Tax=Marimonas lutisalis TaxID=2545756 RepID=UPI0010F9C095|nr:type I secretion system permease/ATPase [Marimonas lutisalis]
MKKPTPLKAVLSEARGQWPLLFVLSFLANILLLASSIYMLQVFDRVLSSGSINTLIWLSVIAFAAIATYGLLEQARRVVLARTGSWLEGELSPHVIRRAITARLAKGRSEADLNDVGDLRGFVAGDAILAFFDAPWTPIFIAVIWLMHPILGLIALGGAILLFAVAILNDALTRRQAAAANQNLRNARRDAGQFIGNAETLAGMGMVGAVISRWQARYAEADTRGRGPGDTTTILFNLSRSFRLMLQIAILGAGAWLVLQAELTAGGMIAASIILSRALSPVERAISAWKSYGSYRNAKTKLARLFAATESPTDRVELPRPKGQLALEGVSYFAPESGNAILKSVAFRLAPGEVCGVLGPSGSGKTTLCKLLVGAWKPSLGKIRLDGADVADWDSEGLGVYLGYLPQAVELFSGTVAENIARLGEVDDEKVLAAAQAAGAHEMILALPNGYETDIGQYADRISGGQRQRIGLARALYGNPSLVVLDEPNSNLDGMGEAALQGALRNIKSVGTTVILVSHLPHLLGLADKVLVLKDGTVARFGPRDEIMRDMMQGAKKLKENAIFRSGRIGEEGKNGVR